jgi:hypothetical protein
MRWSPSLNLPTISSDRVDALDETIVDGGTGSGERGASISLSPIRNVKKKAVGRIDIDNFDEEGQHQLPFSLVWGERSEGEGGLDLLSRGDHGLKPLVLTKTVSSSMLTQSTVIAKEELKPVVTQKSPPSDMMTMLARSYKDDDDIVVVQDSDEPMSRNVAPSRLSKGKKKKKRVDAFVAEVSNLEVDEIDD